MNSFLRLASKLILSGSQHEGPGSIFGKINPHTFSTTKAIATREHSTMDYREERWIGDLRNSILSGTRRLTFGSFLLSGIQQPLVLSKRFVCGRENCADPCNWPPCTPENIAKTECMRALRQKQEAAPVESVYEAYWKKPECCATECVGQFPRFDDMYYRESDKDKRIYTQTWNECPELRTVQKPLCTFEKVRLPEVCRRPVSARPQTAHDMKEQCPPDLAAPCPRIRMPCCRASQKQSCRKNTQPASCKKFMVPTPAFSECRRPELRDRKISECWCLASPSTCQVWAEFRRLQIIKQGAR